MWVPGPARAPAGIAAAVGGPAVGDVGGRGPAQHGLWRQSLSPTCRPAQQQRGQVLPGWWYVTLKNYGISKRKVNSLRKRDIEITQLYTFPRA